MPRGFLVKRYARPGLPGVERSRRYSDEDRSDTSSDHEVSEATFYTASDPLKSSPPPRFNFNLPSLRESKVQEEPLALTASSPTFRDFRQSVLYISGLETTLKTLSTPHRLASESPLTPPPYPPKKRPLLDESPDLQQPVIEPRAKSTKTTTSKRSKVTRKLNFDEDKTSPVSGTFIRDVDSDDDLPAPIRRGDIDPSLNVVVVTEEARAELAKIENRIGDYVCQLCKEHYADAFGLAQHRCSRIVHVEYRCPDCDKVFNCPANLASHRRWHKPRPPPGSQLIEKDVTKKDGAEGSGDLVMDIADSAADENSGVLYDCEVCGKKFRRQAYLRKHLLAHSSPDPLPTLQTELSPIPPPPPVQEDDYLEKSFQQVLTERAKLVLEQSGVLGTLDSRCPICGILVAGRPALDKHMRTHTNETFPCKYCPSIFFSSPGLTRHINKYHPTESRQVILLQVPPSVRPVSS